MLPPPDWKFLLKYFPDAFKAWKRDVGLPDQEFTIGVSGSRKNGTLRLSASDRDWYARHPKDRRMFAYHGDKWERRESGWMQIFNETTRKWEPCE